MREFCVLFLRWRSRPTIATTGPSYGHVPFANVHDLLLLASDQLVIDKGAIEKLKAGVG